MVWERHHLYVTRSQNFLLGATASVQGAALSSGSHMRHTYAQVAVPIPTPSSARLSGLGRGAMTFEEILDQATAMLQRRGRPTYGTLKRQFQLDDAALEDWQNELIKGQRPEQVERPAHHALRGEVWDKALACCRQAGEKAMARSAHREAVGYFEQALCCLPWRRRRCSLNAWRMRRPLPSGHCRSPVSTRNGATRHMPCASSVRLPYVVTQWMSRPPKRTTAMHALWQT